ncbi:MAG TPA: hypothetical protein VGD54_06300 [Steroidobacteraceae bacterium]
MSTEENPVDSSAADQAQADLLSPARREALLNGESAQPAIDPHGVPVKLIEAWSRWAASRLN